MPADEHAELSPQMVLWAYRHGLFPMADCRQGPVAWYTADPRAVIPLDQFKVSRSLQKRVKHGDYHITFDQTFERVIRRCAEPRPYANETWINDRIIEVYTQLHREGHAHSVEAWRRVKPSMNNEGDDTRNVSPHGEPMELVGGLYGVAIAGAFFGESMFSRATDASKVCLVHLVDHLRNRGYTLLDTQFANEHMRQFGLIEIPREEYLRRLKKALQSDVNW